MSYKHDLLYFEFQFFYQFKVVKNIIMFKFTIFLMLDYHLLKASPTN